jgi:hypothetical protein
VLKADQVLTNPNHAARAAYEQRLGSTVAAAEKSARPPATEASPATGSTLATEAPQTPAEPSEEREAQTV